MTQTNEYTNELVCPKCLINHCKHCMCSKCEPQTNQNEMEKIKKEFEEDFGLDLDNNTYQAVYPCDIWNFIASHLTQAREEMLDVSVKMAEKYIMDRPVGSPKYLVLTKNRYISVLKDQLAKEK